MSRTLLISHEFHYEHHRKFYDNCGVELYIVNDYCLENETYYELVNKNYDDYDKVLLVFPQLDYIHNLEFYRREHHIFPKEFEHFKDNWSYFISTLPDKFNYILFDDYPEGTFDTIEKVKLFLESSDRTFLISQRHGNLQHDRVITNLVYLNLINTFYTLGFDGMPMLGYSSPSNPANDFRTYLGMDEDKSKQRFEFLIHYLNNDLSNVKYKDDGDFKPNVTFGSLSMIWNLLESLNSKVQLIFENLFPDCVFDDYYNLTEKTTKAFYLPHPYILLVHATVLDELEKFGFKFSYKCKSNDDFKKLVSEIRTDIGSWIEKNSDDFINNQKILFELNKSIELPHHKFLENIINK